MKVLEAEALIANFQRALIHGKASSSIDQAAQKLIESAIARIRTVIKKAELPEDEEMTALIEQVQSEVLPQVKELDLEALS